MEQKLYKTKQRELIWEYLLDCKDAHITADEICEHLKSNGTSVGKSTVYRYLEKLVEENKVRKFYLDSNSCACYQVIYCDHCSMHYHCKCTNCGKLFHIECEHLNDIHSHILNEHDFYVNPSQTIFYGKCKKCAKSK